MPTRFAPDDESQMRGEGAAQRRRPRRLPLSSVGRMRYMPKENLTPDERGELLKLLRATIAADRFLLSPRMQNLKSVLAKLEPPAPPATEPLPRPRAWVNSSIGQRKRRGRR
jgi:hypothetical protein